MQRAKTQKLIQWIIALCLLLAVPRFASAQTPVPTPSSNAPLIIAIANHGGNAVRNATTIRVTGQSASPRGTMAVVISGDLMGNIRFDYGDPVTRSVINTPNGSAEILNGKSIRKPPHVGLFAKLDILSIFGLMRLETGAVTWSDLGPVAVAGRQATSLRADTGQLKEQYRRTLRDQADIRFDVQTGLISAITRTHYGEKSVDLAMPVTIVFTDYQRTTNNLIFPFRIDSYLNSTLSETITVKSVEINPVFPAGTFER